MKALKYLSIIFLISISFSVISQNKFGGKVKYKKAAIAAKQLVEKMAEKPEMVARVTGTVTDVCQVKGCWMKVALDNGKIMRISFKDYGFFMPKDIAGKTVVFEGIAKKTETTVAELKHYAEDAGKSKEEIEKITAPLKEITFVANGVYIK